MTAIGKGDFVETTRDTSVAPIQWQANTLTRVRGFQRKAGVCSLCGDGISDAIETNLHPAGWASCHCHFKPISGGERGMFDHMLKLDAPNREPVAA